MRICSVCVDSGSDSSCPVLGIAPRESLLWRLTNVEPSPSVTVSHNTFWS
ncbi:hypothetical protein QRX50_10585 [Amycolatopsis carbonis]|uniref:Uncharacterized protein n=1 Tax=Amycolatopsis carbonis TaxID=715471 RepID=A0A9Y2IKZ0_9PSEU|nr:hypothetical protein [Amycolatopsis sp. 2-15]WIX81166.1 hypothetical protein QRX50_10585 [Amycolatopsis sp. 2-15]